MEGGSKDGSDYSCRVSIEIIEIRIGGRVGRWGAEATTSYSTLFPNRFRDALSYRFLSVPYASASRFQYSKVWSPASLFSKSTLDATTPGRNQQCPQTSGTPFPYTENCLVGNWYTPYLPNQADRVVNKGLKPVMMWWVKESKERIRRQRRID